MRYQALDSKASIVWEGAIRGREAAREGRTQDAVRIMECLDMIAYEANVDSLGCVARGAVLGIEDILMNQHVSMHINSTKG